jgi:hypothetical protein
VSQGQDLVLAARDCIETHRARIRERRTAMASRLSNRDANINGYHENEVFSTHNHLQRHGLDHGAELISRAGLNDVGRVVEHHVVPCPLR